MSRAARHHIEQLAQEHSLPRCVEVMATEGRGDAEIARSLVRHLGGVAEAAEVLGKACWSDDRVISALVISQKAASRATALQSLLRGGWSTKRALAAITSAVHPSFDDDVRLWARRERMITSLMRSAASRNQ